MNAEQRLEKEGADFLLEIYQGVNFDIGLPEVVARDEQLKKENGNSPSKMLENLKVLEKEFGLPRMRHYMCWYGKQLNK